MASSFSEPKQLNRGLMSPKLADLTPDGALLTARNLTYDRATLSPGPAPGRVRTGPPDAAPLLAKRFCPLSWDSDLASGNPRKSELLYALDDRMARTLVASGTPTDGRLGSALALPLGDTGLAGDQPFDVVPVGRDHYLFGGDRPVWVRRASGNEEVTPAQFPLQSIPLHATHAGGGPGPSVATAYWYWFCWWDDTRKIMSGLDPLASLGIKQLYDNFGPANVPVGGNPKWFKSWAVLGPADALVKLRVEKGAFDEAAALNPTATHIAVFRTLGVTAETLSPFPAGFHLHDKTIVYQKLLIPIATVQASATEVVSDYGVARTCYYFYQDNYATMSDSVLQQKEAFPLVRVAMDGVSTGVARNNGFPRSSTACFWHGSIVMDDVDAPQRYWWTFPDEPHNVPVQFFGNIESDETDAIVAIRALRGRCGIWGKNSVTRINYLPSSADLNFREGRQNDPLCRYGLPSKRAIARCSPPGMGEILVWANRTGLYFTSTLYEVDEWSTLVDWPGLIGDAGGLASAILVDDPEQARLWLFFGAGASGHPDQALVIHYGKLHLVNSLPSITGPIDRPAGVRDAWTVTLEDGSRRVVTLTPAGDLLYEGLGLADEAHSPAPLEYELETDRFYLGGKGQKTRLFLIGLDIANDSGSPVPFEVWLRYLNDGIEKLISIRPSAGAAQVDTAGGLLIFDAPPAVEWVAVRIKGASAPIRFDSISFAWEPQGIANRRSVPS